MATGPGKYDGITTLVREQTEAYAVILMVIDGNRGTGFSVQTRDPALVAGLPSFLRIVADEIEVDLQPKGHG